MARLRSAPSTQNAPPVAQTTTSTRQALKEKTNTARSKAPVYEDDGITDALVKNARPRRGRAKKAAQNEDELVMAGGLGHAETERQTLLPIEHPTTTDELAKSDEPLQPNAKQNRRPPRMTRKAVQSESKSEVLQDMKRRMLATAGKEATTTESIPSQTSQDSANEAATLLTKSRAARKSANATHQRSKFSLSPSPPLPGKLTAVKDKPSSLAQQGSTTKAQVTPAIESSVLALKNFKRRPRQPSMLQMVQQRTASARPSVVNAPATEDPTVYDVEDDEEFAPEAEGTPLHASKAKPLSAVGTKRVSKSKPESPNAPSPVAAAKKRKSDETDLSSSALGTLKAKRQRMAAQQRNEDLDAAFMTSVPDAALPPSISDAALLTSKSVRPSSSVRQVTPQPQITSDVQVIDSEPSTTPPTEPSSDEGRVDENPDMAVPSTDRQRLHDPEFIHLNDLEEDREQDIPSGTMAEPASSSPLPSPRAVTQPKDVVADPLTQVSPPAKRERTQKTKAKPITTATLQSLLPKRRQPLKARNRVSEYDIESDSDQDNGIDPEADVEQRARSRRQTKAAPSEGKKAATATKDKSRQSKATHTARKPSVPPGRKSSAPAPTKKPGKTYGRAKATTSDKENEDDVAFESLHENDESALPDTSLSMYEAAQSKELEEARKKFAEVDEWDMEFESMSVEEGRSSSQNWR